MTFTAACSSSPTAPSPTASTSLTSQAAAESSSDPQDEPAPDSSSGSSPAPPATTSGTPLGATRFVALGDSITWGTLSSFDGTFLYDAGPTQSYPYQLQTALNTFHSPQIFTVENRGIPGESVASGAARIHSVLSDVRPQVLLLLEGINDLNNGASIGGTVDHLRTILDVARLHNVTVLIATMFQTYHSEDPNNGRVRENSAEQIPSFNSAIVQMAQGRQNVFIVDMYGAFGSNRSYVGGDGLHPSEAGYERMAVAFGTKTAEAFAVRAAFQ